MTVSSKSPPRLYSPGEYLALEETAESRSEYQNGALIPMTGGSANHNLIVINLCTLLKIALKSQQSTDTEKAKVFASDLRVWIPHHRCYTYPDVFVIKGAPQFQDDRSDVVMNPTLIVEVLSKSTRDYDRGDKFRFYRSIPSFAEYLLVDQYQTQIEQFSKIPSPSRATGEEDIWVFRTYDTPNAMLELSSLGFPIAIADLYEDVMVQAPST